MLCCVLQLCVILEPMQELMSRHKAYGLTPRDCLKTTLFQKWQRMVAPPGELSEDRVNGDHRRPKSVYLTGGLRSISALRLVCLHLACRLSICGCASYTTPLRLRLHKDLSNYSFARAAGQLIVEHNNVNSVMFIHCIRLSWGKFFRHKVTNLV